MARNLLYRVTVTYGAAHFNAKRSWTCIMSAPTASIHEEARAAFREALGTPSTGPASSVDIYQTEARELPGHVFYQRQPGA